MEEEVDVSVQSHVLKSSPWVDLAEAAPAMHNAKSVSWGCTPKALSHRSTSPHESENVFFTGGPWPCLCPVQVPLVPRQVERQQPLVEPLLFPGSYPDSFVSFLFLEIILHALSTLAQTSCHVSFGLT